MASTFFGIQVAYSGLSAQRRAMDVVGYNIAHANDPTYKRQRLVMSEMAVLAQSQEANVLNNSPFGAGVSSQSIERIRDAIVENRVRMASQAAANWEYRAQVMRQLESVIGEPSDNGLQATLDQFWASWQKAAVTPESVPIRKALLEDANALCQQIQYVYSQLRSVINDLNMAAADRVNRINAIVQEIGKLNSEIGNRTAGEVPANDLLNRRDALVVELSKLAAVSQHGETKENFIVSIGGRVLIQGTKINLLTTETDANGNLAVRWASDSEDVVNTGGELRAIIDLRDTVVSSYLSQLDGIASALVENVNALHRTGITLTGQPGGDFFAAGSTASTISLDFAIADHPELIAASATGAVGDGELARQISLLKDAPVSNGQTINQLYRTLVGDIGTATAVADRQVLTHRLSLEQFITQQQSISGVSLDEEMTNMIKFQQAYNASARVLTVMDEMLDVIIERTGVVGR